MLQVNELNGFGGLSNLSVIEKVSSSTSSGSNSITAPSDVKSGDLMVMVDYSGNGLGGTPVAVTPSGWTNLVNISSVPVRFMVHKKIANGSEASSSITGMSNDGSSVGISKIIVVFRGNASAISINNSSINTEASGVSPSTQTVLASIGKTPLIVFGNYGAYTGSAGPSVDPRTFSPSKDDEIERTSDLLDCWIAWKIYNSSSQDVSIGMDDEGTNFLSSFYIEMM